MKARDGKRPMRSSASLAGSRKSFQTAREGAGAAVSEPRGSGQSWPPVPRARERLPGLCLGSDECSKAVHPAGARPSLPTTLRRGQCSCDSLQGPPRPGPAWPTRLTTRHFPQTPELHPPCLPHAVAPPAGVHLTSPLVSYVGAGGWPHKPAFPVVLQVLLGTPGASHVPDPTEDTGLLECFHPG